VIVICPIDVSGSISFFSLAPPWISGSSPWLTMTQSLCRRFNRGSVVLGSAAYYMDRYGYDVLPLGLRLLAGQALPPRTVTRHVLVAAAFREYPASDIN
jgi:hypothetical protein